METITHKSNILFRHSNLISILFIWEAIFLSFCALFSLFLSRIAFILFSHFIRAKRCGRNHDFPDGICLSKCKSGCRRIATVKSFFRGRLLKWLQRFILVYTPAEIQRKTSAALWKMFNNIMLYDCCLLGIIFIMFQFWREMQKLTKGCFLFEHTGPLFSIALVEISARENKVIFIVSQFYLFSHCFEVEFHNRGEEAGETVPSKHIYLISPKISFRLAFFFMQKPMPALK